MTDRDPSSAAVAASLPPEEGGRGNKYFEYMNILAIDYGTKNIGLARASTSLDVVLPFGTVENTDKNLGAQKLIKLIKKEKIDKIIVGLPLGLDGSENKNTERVRKFVDEIKKEINISVEFITEIFSSQAADRMRAGVSRDEKSAMVILQSYLATASGRGAASGRQ